MAVLKFPLRVSWRITQEFGALIFYHRNFKENLYLRSENAKLKAGLNLLNELYQENKRLRELLNFKQSSEFKLTTCKVIGRDPDNWSSMVILDKGTLQNIRKNQLVITPAGVAGKVIEEGISTSKVILINDPNFKIAVVSQNSRQEGLASGTLQRNLTLRYLSTQAQITLGEAVVTSGLDQLYPKGILVGKIISVRYDSSGLVRECLIEPAVDVFRLEEVLVIIK